VTPAAFASPLLSDRHRMIGEAVRKFAAERVRPHAQALDEGEVFPAEVYR
jgi:alkylation response protein AidB-like acyl-CoA dehydrogenase